MTITAPERTTFAVGDEVTVNHSRCAGQVYVVARVKQVKCILKRKGVAGDRGLDVPMDLMVKYDPANPTQVAPIVTRMALPTVSPGEVVRLLRPFRRNTTETLLVVTKVNQTTVSLDPLGGPANGTPMRISHTQVTKVDLADILR